MHRLGNQFLTGLHNILYGSSLNDVYTCYKVARRGIYNSLDLEADGFSLEQEIVGKAIKRKLRIMEVPIAYHPRTYAQGKKIRYYDAFKIIIRMIRSRFRRKDKVMFSRTDSRSSSAASSFSVSSVIISSFVSHTLKKITFDLADTRLRFPRASGASTGPTARIPLSRR